MTLDFGNDGIYLGERVLSRAALDEVVRDLLRVAKIVTGKTFPTLDEAWNHIKSDKRELGSLLYNAAKLCPRMHQLAASGEVLGKLLSLGVRAPAIVDLNFRIDTRGEEKYLFGWHQDYWFSICSPRAVVAWIPLTPLDGTTGGVELIPTRYTKHKIFKARKGQTYNSYADGAVLAESIPDHTPVRFLMNDGDVLFFRFDVLHRSLPVLVENKSRWTLQIRYADFEDAEFQRESFRPSSVKRGDTPYLGNA